MLDLTTSAVSSVWQYLCLTADALLSSEMSLLGLGLAFKKAYLLPLWKLLLSFLAEKSSNRFSMLCLRLCLSALAENSLSMSVLLVLQSVLAPI